MNSLGLGRDCVGLGFGHPFASNRSVFVACSTCRFWREGDVGESGWMRTLDISFGIINMKLLIIDYLRINHDIG